MASVHTMVTFQAFKGLEHGIVGAQFFVCIPKRGRGSLCPGLKGSASIRDEDTCVCLRKLCFFITTENASLTNN